MLSKQIPTQEIAADVLVEVECGKELVSAKEAMKSVLSSLELDIKVRGSVHAYVMETLKRLNTIDFIINLCLKNKKVHELNPFLRNILRIGIYEMFYRDIHPALATDSTVRVVRRRLGKKAASLANAVMRKAEHVKLDEELRRLNFIERVAYEYYHPVWFVKQVLKLIGNDAFELMKANMENTVYVRVNELKSSIESVVRYLEKTCDVEETVLPYVFKVNMWEKHPSILEWHAKGKYVIQDLASALVAHVMSPEPGEYIVDLAAAPGIKTSQIAMMMENRGKIVAIDNSKSRLERMKLKMKQLGVEIVDCKFGDGVTFKPERRADRVLVDPPCSTSGAFRNYPCVKWRFDRSKYYATISLQRKMIENALSIADVCVYSTCSVTFEENEGNLIPFESYVSNIKLGKIDGWKSVGIQEFEGRKFRKWKYVIRTWPHIHDCCGFFIAKLTKK